MSGGDNVDDVGPLLNTRIALVLAVVPALFGFLGIGQMYMRHWIRGIGLLILGWFFLAIPSMANLIEHGPAILIFKIPVIGWPLFLNPDSSVVTEYGYGSVVGFFVGSYMIYVGGWMWSIYAAVNDWK